MKHKGMKGAVVTQNVLQTVQRTATSAVPALENTLKVLFERIRFVGSPRALCVGCLRKFYLYFARTLRLRG